MNTATWKENDDVSGSRREETTNGKTVISKVPPPSSSSSSSSWIRSKDPRIVRVSRALGGKDRHSKVCTLRGLRDRRVRLSVPTAIQLYDLQDRLGVDQPSKVVDWLLNAAKDEIDELPPLPISPENFTILNHHHHHHRQSFLNLNPGLGPSQEPGQLGFKIGGDDSTTLTTHKDEDEERCLDEDNEEGKQNEVVLGTNIHQLQHHHHHHHHVESSHGSSYNLDDDDDHHHHSGFHDHHHHHQSNNLVPFPSQIFICPTMTQSLFPSPAEIIDPRQTVNQFQVPASASSRNVSTLYSLIHNIRTPIQFDHVNNANANASNVSRIIGSESSTNG